MACSVPVQFTNTSLSGTRHWQAVFCCQTAATHSGRLKPCWLPCHERTKGGEGCCSGGVMHPYR